MVKKSKKSQKVSKQKQVNRRFIPLIVFFGVTLVLQLVILVPLLILNVKSLFRVAPSMAITSILSEFLLFVVLLISAAYSLEQYRAN